MTPKLSVKALSSGISYCMPSSYGLLLQQSDLCPLPTRGRTIVEDCHSPIPWHLWLERNSRVFEDKSCPLESLVEKCTHDIIAWAAATKKLPPLPSSILRRHWEKVILFNPLKPIIAATWKPPPTGWYALNFDGSSLGNPGPAGIGGALRDSSGQISLIFSGPMGNCSSNEAESQALLAGIKLFKQRLNGPLQIQGDSKLAISWGQINSHPWHLKHIYDEIRDLVHSLSVEWMHIPRAANSLADSLAREGVSRTTLAIGHTLPLV